MKPLSSNMIRLTVAAAILGHSCLAGIQAYAQTGETPLEAALVTPASGSGLNILPGKGTIVVEQKSGAEDVVLGKWLLILPDNKQQTGSGTTVTLPDSRAGSYTMFVTLPTGASATIRTYRNDVAEATLQRPQASFTLKDGETMRVVVHYTITQVGLVSVDSDPQGIDFQMSGPNDSVITGKTPASYPTATKGQYKVLYSPLPGCITPAPQSLLLEAGNRISFSIRMSCPAADKLRERQTDNQVSNTNNIVIESNGQKVALRDVPQAAWFATYVFNTAKYGILSGYTDAAGNPTGEFGPGNNVTIAELSKTAHKIAGISADSFAKASPENPRAVGQWFSPYFASAESRGWTIFSSATIDPARPATRGEVLVTLLQALDIRLNWQKGTYFTDVSARTPFAAAIETAAETKVVQGRTDANGKALNTFGPADPINRAELAKILSAMIDTYRGISSSSASPAK